jgi:hypothetical protein
MEGTIRALMNRVAVLEQNVPANTAASSAAASSNRG